MTSTRTSPTARCPPFLSSSPADGWTATEPRRSWIYSKASSKRLWTKCRRTPPTAIFVTFDEGGGYWDSGYVQPLDYFGDGTRIPLIVVSPFTNAGHISHDYGDHVSILKFIERNWQLSPLTNRSRDNFPNPQYDKTVSAYAPTNSPAIGDLFDLFNFDPASSGSTTTASAGTSDPTDVRHFGHSERVGLAIRP